MIYFYIIIKVRLPNEDCSDDFFENQLKKGIYKIMFIYNYI